MAEKARTAAQGVRNAILLTIRGFQRVVSLAFLVIIAGFLARFGLQFAHSPKLDSLWVVNQIYNWWDPALARVAEWAEMTWPPLTASFLPLGLAVGTWVVKLAVDHGFQRFHQAATEALGGGRKKADATFAGLGGVFADSERSRDELLKRYREIEDALKAQKRKRCAFLSVDVVGSTGMKTGEEATAIAATFQAYEEMVKEIFNQHGVWKVAWTPDGVMACFLQLDLAVGAGLRLLQSLRDFNRHKNKLRTAFRVRCGLNEGEVALFEDSKLEKVADHVIDVAGHMQKQARPNALWLSGEVYQNLADKAGFNATGQVVDGHDVYEWAILPAQAPAPAPAPVAAPPPAPVALTADGETAVGVAFRPGPSRVPTRAEIEAGKVKIGRYEVVGLLGQGAMGAVYKARDPRIGRTVAIKMILTGTQSEEELEEYKKRFYREAQTAGQMSHPGIVGIYDVAEDEAGQPYLVMEFVEGMTLEKILAPGKGTKAPRPSIQQSLSIAIQVAEALDYAHRQNVIHRDIKPANILVTPEGKAKIADFGIAKLAGTQMTQTGLLVGTPAFMSPEQITGGKVDSRSDIFSFGVMFYWMCTGLKPFAGNAITEVAYKVVHAQPPPARQVNAELPPGIDVVLERCLAKKPDQRYASARELVADLEAVKAGQPLAAAPVPAAPVPSSPTPAA